MGSIQQLKEVVKNQSGYTFTTDNLTFSTTELKGQKQAYVTGYISSPDVDLYNDVITDNAMKSMLEQIENSTITIDYEHEAWRDDNSILPVAKIVEAKIDDRGLWVKCLLNKNSPKYKALWGSIKDGFINAFSIAFQPLITITKDIDGTSVRLIEDLKLLNVAFTGAPVNEGAKMTEFGMKSVMLKAIADSELKGDSIIVPKSLITKLLEEKSMEEQDKIVEEVKTEEPVVEEIKEEKVEEEIKEEKVEEEKVEEKVEEEKVEPTVEEIKENELLTEMKALVEEQKSLIKKQAAELKAFKEEKVFKSPTPIKPEIKSTEDNTVAMLGLIR